MKKRLQIVCAVLIVAAVAGVTVYAANGYDSTTDPLVSLSYITNVLKPQLDTEITALKAEVQTLKTEIAKLGTDAPATSPATTPATPATSPETTPVSSAYSYEIVELRKGDKLLATSSCDIVLRSGKATVVSPFNQAGFLQGLNDYTDGTELLSGASVPMNHFLLVPRGNDGRGIEITSEAGAFVIVRGGYKIVNAE